MSRAIFAVCGLKASLWFVICVAAKVIGLLIVLIRTGVVYVAKGTILQEIVPIPGIIGVLVQLPLQG